MNQFFSFNKKLDLMKIPNNLKIFWFSVQFSRLVTLKLTLTVLSVKLSKEYDNAVFRGFPVPNTFFFKEKHDSTYLVITWIKSPHSPLFCAVVNSRFPWRVF